MSTGMNTYKRRHFHNVARNMNNYVAVYGHRRQHPQITDQENYLLMYPRHSTSYHGYSGLFASSLRQIGMPSSLVDFGYGFGSFFDSIF